MLQHRSRRSSASSIERWPIRPRRAATHRGRAERSRRLAGAPPKDAEHDAGAPGRGARLRHSGRDRRRAAGVFGSYTEMDPVMLNPFECWWPSPASTATTRGKVIAGAFAMPDGGHLHRPAPDAGDDRQTRLQEDAHVIGLSILSGAHRRLCRAGDRVAARAGRGRRRRDRRRHDPRAGHPPSSRRSGSQRCSRPAPRRRRIIDYIQARIGRPR